MPRTRSLAWSELKIGILAVFALVMAAVMVFAVGGTGFLTKKYRLYARFANVQGLKAGAVVRAAGVEVGTVDKVEFGSGAEVVVAMDVLQEMQSRITTESRASIGAVSLLGERSVDVTVASKGEALPDGGTISTLGAPATIDEVADSANRGLQQATALIEDLRAGKGTVGKLFTDDALYKEINTFVQSAEAVTTKLNSGKGTIPELLNNPDTYRDLRASLKNLEAMTRRINAGEGSLGRLMNDDAFAKTLSSTTENLDRLTGRLNRGEGTAGKLLNETELYDKLNALTTRMDALLAQINSGDGTVGRLLQDKQLYENMNGAVRELQRLVEDIRKDPRKYLQVRVSIF
jgi:phospholipid/cholesterol/gamma-HCH transport system substrate-binding protein